MFIRLLYSSSVKEIFIAPVNHEQIPTNANDPQKQTQQLWIKKVDVNPCRWEFLWSNNRTSNRNLARTKKRKLLQYYYRTWHKLAVIKQMPLHISLNPSTVTPPFPFDNLKYMKEGQTGWTRELHNFGYAALMIATLLKSHILFKARALGSSLLQPKGDWVNLCFQYYSHCWNQPSPITQFTLFLSLPPIPNILRASSPVLREVLRYKYFYLMDALGRIAKRAQELEVLDPVPCALCTHWARWWCQKT